MRRVREKLGWLIATTLALFVVGSLAGVVRGGPLVVCGVVQHVDLITEFGLQRSVVLVELFV